MKLPRFILPLLLPAATYTSLTAQVRWDGEGGDGQWFTAANWTGNVLPASTDDVILDNTFMAGSYTVILPSGNLPVAVRSLAIIPATGQTIEVVLPATNTASPAFIANKSGYALMIHSGGIFRNASGVSSGETFQVSDSMIIYNGGKYVHQNRGRHADHITGVLAKRPGTESGIFEFDVPASLYGLSLSDRTYGHLTLSSQAYGNAVTYSVIGTNPIAINSDLAINNQVRLTCNASDTLFIKGNLIHAGDLINLSSSTRKLTVALEGNWTQFATATITETGSAGAEILLAGQAAQVIDCQGTIGGDVAVKLNNTAGVTLQDTLTLPYRLTLSRGLFTTSATGLLVLSPACSLKVDSLSSNSFINGPVRKEGLSGTAQFLFPVGKGNMQRWLSLTQATGSYTVEFFRANPRLLSNVYESSLHHISSIEYWSIEADVTPAPQARVKLSFNDPNSGGVTDLAALRVAQLTGGTWTDRGNTIMGGTAGSNGFVNSGALTMWDVAARYFSLASSTENLNPLYVTTARYTRADNILQSIVLAPSATTGYTQLRFTASKKSKVQLSITDMSGAVLQTWPAYLQPGVNTLPVQVAHLKPGMYVLTVYGERGILYSTRFIKL